MRLSSIKLSGFKSFADSTQFSLPGQLIGVVGPNGCGKSNIMDAVRWVLGESRASELRGESMQDVIFNGSGTRKPAGRASVELVFDNSTRRVAGQWGQYSEIAVKRVLIRDTGSSYFINNQSVRRRDVHDLFLGTGLGPRAYAIIGQGTISRLIESRPQELRLFLEEAAGVSRYKDRRRESENRLQDARENLIRVEDLLGELSSQLEKLERQAAIAKRYQYLQKQHSQIQQQWWWLKQSQAELELKCFQNQGLSALNDLEAGTAALRAQEARLDGLRQTHYAAGDTVNSAQGQMYEANATLAKLEAEVRFSAQNRERIGTRLQQIEQGRAQWAERLQISATEGLALQAAKEGLQEQLRYREAQCEQERDLLPEYKAQKVQAQEAAQTARERVHLVQQQIQVLSTEQGHAQEQLCTLAQRLEHLQQEQDVLQVVDEQLVLTRQEELVARVENLTQASAQVEALIEALQACEAEREAGAAELSAEDGKLMQLRARASALAALQEKVQAEGKRQPWLDKHGLTHLRSLWTQLHVDVGWENALEAALRERLQSLEVGRLEGVAALQIDAPPVKLGFYTKDDAAVLSRDALVGGDAASDASDGVDSNRELQALVFRVRCKDINLMAVLRSWLAHCLCADSLEQALKARHTLRPGQIILVPQGHVVTRSGLDFYAADSAQAGMLARAQELEILDESIRIQSALVENLRGKVQTSEARYAGLRSQLTAQQSSLQTKERECHALEVEALRVQQELKQYRMRQNQLAQDHSGLQASAHEWKERAVQAQARFDELDGVLAEFQEIDSVCEDQVLNADKRLEDAKEAWRVLERQLQEAHFEQRNLETKAMDLQRFTETAKQQDLDLQAETERLQNDLAQIDESVIHTGLQQTLEHKNACEEALREARNTQDAVAENLRQAQEQRMAQEQTLEPLRTKITELQLQEQAARIAVEQNQQALREAGADIEMLATSAQSETLAVDELPAELERLQRAIDNLGAVNLAALEELDATRERQGFLQVQTGDLTQAMQTLEDTIRKIDVQTRDLLGSTFDSVNTHLGALFPALFGGGQAQLVMTGDEILDAGVQVMARPPGKKNQTIHLLSGGEKALAAIALIFAIFQLNPAPFCLLDEVDAPLDDANTERYARLVQRMSQETQFLFISHNKISMEAAQQLIGVTMQEQGVSRIVAVDIQAAASLVTK